MDNIRAMIYINHTGNDALDNKAAEIMKQYCDTKGYEIVVIFGEDTDKTGVSEPTKYMLAGLAAEKQIDVVITMFSQMLADNIEDTIALLAKLLEYDVMAETIKDDLDDYYDIVFEHDMCKGCHACEEMSAETLIQELLKSFYEE